MDPVEQFEALRREAELTGGKDPFRLAIGDCDSPIEDQFLWEFNKVAHHEVAVRRQVEIETDVGLFRLDFVIERLPDGGQIGIECDGRDFHSDDRDSKRDAAIVRTGVVNRIYRLKGADICWHIYELLDLLGDCEPWILSLRGKINLDSRTLPASQRRDSIGRYGVFFPFAAIRMYEQTSDDMEDDTYDDGDGIYPRRPIVVVWTQ